MHQALRQPGRRAGSLAGVLLSLLAVGPVRADAPAAPGAGPVVDRYGQPVAETWPGKAINDADLTQAAQKEADALASYIRPPDRDVYGGWSGSPLEGRLFKTGFFHTTEIENVWWLVTPEGDPFLSLSCAGVRAGDATVVEGRKDLFSWVPDPRDPRFAPALAGSGGKVLSFYRANLLRKFGPLAANRSSLDVAVKRLRAWGLNTVGAESDTGLLVPGKVPYLAEVSLDPAASPALPRAPGSNIPDVYAPSWAAQWNARAQAVSRFADDPWCVGYVARGDGVRWDRWPSPLGLPSSFAGRGVFVGFLRQEYGEDVARFNKAWGTSVKSFDDIAALSEGDIKTRAARSDSDAFFQQYVATYFRAIRQAIQAGDKHHLFLGSPLSLSGDLPAPALRGAADTCDALCLSVRGDKEPPVALLRRIYETAQKPLWLDGLSVGASGAEGHGLEGGPAGAATQTARAAVAARFLDASWPLPFVIGIQWRQWVDQPATGRVRDGAHADIGLVDITDTPYAALTAALQKCSVAMYTAHAGQPSLKVNSR